MASVEDDINTINRQAAKMLAN